MSQDIPLEEAIEGLLNTGWRRDAEIEDCFCKPLSEEVSQAMRRTSENRGFLTRAYYALARIYRTL